MAVKRFVSNDFVVVDTDDTISKLLGKLKKSKKHNAIVVKDKRFVGVIDRRKLLQSKIKVDEEKIKKFVKRVSAVSSSDDVKDVARKMAFSDVHMLPIVNKEKMPTGVVYAIDIVGNLPELQLHRKLIGFEKPSLIKFNDDDAVGKVINVLRLKKIQHAPLVNKIGKLTGIISAVDILQKYNMFPRKKPRGKSGGKKPNTPTGKKDSLVSLPISNFSTSAVVYAHRKDTIRKAIKLMKKNYISDVVITNDFDEPTGIITMKDLVDLAMLYI